MERMATNKFSSKKGTGKKNKTKEGKSESYFRNILYGCQFFSFLESFSDEVDGLWE